MSRSIYDDPFDYGFGDPEMDAAVRDRVHNSPPLTLAQIAFLDAMFNKGRP